MIIWWQMIVIRGLLSYGRKLGYENIKVTTPEDMKIAEVFLHAQGYRQG